MELQSRAREGGNAEALRGVGGIVELVQNRSVRLSLELPRTRSVRISRIFDKVGSSRVIKTHQDMTFSVSIQPRLNPSYMRGFVIQILFLVLFVDPCLLSVV